MRYPWLEVCAAYRLTVPVGVGLPLPPSTVTLTMRSCAVVALAGEKANVTVGVIRVTFTSVVPDALK